jgi:hypothetical protein
MNSEVQAKGFSPNGNDAIDSLAKITALLEASKWLSISTNKERDLHYELIDAVLYVINQVLYGHT